MLYRMVLISEWFQCIYLNVCLPIFRYFDLAGGHILDEVLKHMKPRGVIGSCGAMAGMSGNYNTCLPLNFDHTTIILVLDSQLTTTLKNFAMIIMNSLELKGFTMMEYMDRVEEGGKALADAVLSGKFVAGNAETVVDLRGKLEEVPKVWHGMFEGKNTGKWIIKLAD